MIAKEQLNAAIRAAANYLIRQCGETGQFEYRVNLDADVAVKRKYNLVRHAGAMCALSWYTESAKDDAAKAAVGRAAEFLRANIAPVSNAPRRHAVWSCREVEGRRQPTQCKLGAAGLALVALGLARKLDSQFASSSELTALAEFVIYMQKDTGQFYSKYYPRPARRSDEWTSLYYPGEAALGLLVAHRNDSDSRWLYAAERALGYLSEQRRGRFPVEADHWALLATAEYLRVINLAGPRPSSEKLLQHAAQVCESMLHEQFQSGGHREGCGWFTSDCRTTPTATRVEGLLAALRFLPDSLADLRDRIAQSIVKGIQFLLRSQIQDGRWAGAVPRVNPAANEYEKGRDADGGRRATEVRIDYVQHALCAMIQCRELNLLSAPRPSIEPPADFGVCQVNVGLF